MIKVGVCAGHGGFGVTPGKRTPDGEYEWDFNNIVVKAFINELAMYREVATKRFDDPTGKRDVPLDERTDGAIAWGADYYISFHHNANTAKWGTWGGVETHIYQNPNAKSIALANALHPALVTAYELRDRGIKRTNLHITREMQKSGAGVVLVEGGFMDSTIDIIKLRDNSVLESTGKLIAQALAKYLGLKRNGDDDEMDFYSPTMRDKYNMRTASPATKKLLVEQAVAELGYQPSWITNHEKGVLKNGDYAAIAFELAVHYAKK